MKFFFTGTLVATLIFSSAYTFAQESVLSSSRYVADEVIVTYTSAPAPLQAGLRNSSLAQESAMGQDTAVLKTRDGQTVAQLIQDLQDNPNVKSAQPNFRYHTFAVSNDPNF